MSTTKSVALHTLGCKLNYSETSSMQRLLENDGFVKKDFSEVADVYVVNTCSVTENADKECRLLVRRIQRKAPKAMVVITGCYAQLKPKEIAAIDGVDLVLGAAEKFNITTHLHQLTKGDPAKICSCDIEEVNGFHSSFSINNRTRTFLKVPELKSKTGIRCKGNACKRRTPRRTSDGRSECAATRQHLQTDSAFSAGSPDRQSNEFAGKTLDRKRK